MARIAFVATGSSALLALAAGCGGGGSAARVVQQAVTLALEGPALTDADATTLHGATDPRAGVVALAAGGIAASSADGFATFAIDVPLQPGENALEIESVDDRGRSRRHAVPPLRRETPLLGHAAGAAIAPIPKGSFSVATANGATGELFLVDPATGARTLVSGPGRGSGGSFAFPTQIVARADGKQIAVLGSFGGFVLVDVKTGDREFVTIVGTDLTDAADDPVRGWIAYLELFQHELRGVDPASGVDTLISDGEDDLGPGMLVPIGLEYDERGDRYVVLDRNLPGLLAVDPDSGKRKVLSDFADSAAGPVTTEPQFLALDASRQRAWTRANETDELIEIDLTTGKRTVALAADDGSGLSLQELNSLASLGGDRLVGARGDALLVLDVAAGTREELARVRVGSGAELAKNVHDVARPAHDRRRHRLLHATFDGSIVEVDLRSGDRRIVLDSSDDDGPAGAENLWLDDASGRLFAIDRDDESLVELDRGDFSARTISSADRGSGEPMVAVLGFSVDVAHDRAFVVEGFPRCITTVDLSSGDRSTLAAPGDGNGVAISTLFDVDYDPVLDRVLAVDNSVAGLIVIDPATGARSLFVDFGGPGVPPLPRFFFFLDHADHALYIPGIGTADPPFLMRLDLSTGERSVVFDQVVGRGPAALRFDQPAGDAANGRLWLHDSTLHAIVQVDLASGDRLIVSR